MTDYNILTEKNEGFFDKDLAADVYKFNNTQHFAVAFAVTDT